MNIEEVHIKDEDIERLKNISAHDKKLLKMLEEGLSSDEISKKIKVKKRTVEDYRLKLTKLFKVNNTTKAVKKARDLGIIILFLLPIFSFSQINSLAGGRVQYKVLGASHYTQGDSAYFIGVYLYKKKLSADIAPYYGYPDSITVFIWNNDTGLIHAHRRQALANVVDVPADSVLCNGTINPADRYTRAEYGVTVDFHINITGYTASTQICCRLNGYANIADNQGATYWCLIPPISMPENNPDFGL